MIMNSNRSTPELRIVIISRMDISSQKLYTVNPNTVYSNFGNEEPDSALFLENKEPWPGFGPGTFALPRQRSTRLSYQGANAP
jgi:hypothetical protein